jgi:putative membrane protein
VTGQVLASFDFRVLADVNATLNLLATILIVAGLAAIKRRNERAHKVLMLSAAAMSALFLVSYVVYHTNAEPVSFAGEGVVRVVYLVILGTHVVLAIVQVPLILLTIRRGLRDDRARHRKLARITAPIWLYVSVTGVIVYLMLYRW